MQSDARSFQVVIDELVVGGVRVTLQSEDGAVRVIGWGADGVEAADRALVAMADAIACALDLAAQLDRAPAPVFGTFTLEADTGAVSPGLH